MSRTPPGYYSVSGISPDGKETWDFLVSIEMLRDLERKGPTAKFYDARLLKGVLESPAAVFQDLHREGFEEAYCYCGSPPHRFRSAEIQMPPPPRKVFLVYVTSDHRGHIVLDWEWRPAHLGKAGHPIKCESDFGRQTWPKTS
jgi:hypothetical protein